MRGAAAAVRGVLVGLVAATTLAVSAAPSAAAVAGRISVDGARIRSCAGTGSACRVLALGYFGDAVTLKCHTTVGGRSWSRIHHHRSGKTGYVYGEYVYQDAGNGDWPPC
ncbi:SH3 domain-containing protein [Streptomyces sp. NPDC090445]|uniref:SH3 domain-containing protein n=1 Tax=Streptomyces sp. NPDC090445 TaxID=3365963 RepID=UPI0037F80E6F